MRIDHEKFPALFDKSIVLKQLEYAILPDQAIELFKGIIDEGRSNLFYIAKTIMTPVLSSLEKLEHLRDNIQDTFRGLAFVSKRGNPHVFFYTIHHIDNKIHIMGQVSCVDQASGGQHYGELFAGYFYKNTGKPHADFMSYNYLKNNPDVLQEVIRAILSVELFILYAEVETKVCQPSRQIWDGPTCLYNNKTIFPFTVLDSTWFTHLVSSGAFNVRGHFRLQPCGHGHTDRRLVWINDFQKKGYTRKAKIEMNNP